MNKKTKALTTEQYKEIIGAMKKRFSGYRPNERIATILVLEGNLGLRISDIRNSDSVILFGMATYSVWTSSSKRPVSSDHSRSPWSSGSISKTTVSATTSSPRISCSPSRSVLYRNSLPSSVIT